MVGDRQLLDRRFRVLGKNAPLFYDEPLHVVRGEGVWLYDSEGRRFLDVYNNVPHVGHCHPRVVKALCEQAATLNVHTRYLHENIVRYAERLTATFASELSMAQFTCSGTEANELALRVARSITGAKGVIVTDFNYHGNSAALSEMATALMHPEPIGAHVRPVSVPNLLEAQASADPVEIAQQYAQKVAHAVSSLQEAGFGVAALLFDTHFTSEGLPTVPREYLELAIAPVRAAGGLFIADEVQAGFGRTGNVMWGHQHFNVVPDIVTLGKPMGNGHPLAGLVTRPEYLNAFGARAHYFNTFGGNPVSAAAGLAVLDIIEEEGLMQNARMVGEYVQSLLRALAARRSIIGDVRGRGLFFGAALRRDGRPATDEARKVVNAMRQRGVLISRTGPYDNVLKMRPPMVFSRENADLLIDTLDGVLALI